MSPRTRTAYPPVDPVVRKWWDMMAEYMETNQDNSPKTWPLAEMFWMEDTQEACVSQAESSGR